MSSITSTNFARAQVYQVFISSTFIDLAAERRAVHNALSELYAPLSKLGVCLIPRDLQSGAAAQPSLEVCLQELEQCDLTIVIVGHRAGTLCKDGRSITEREFIHAQEKSIPRLVYLRDPSAMVPPRFVDTDADQVRALNRFKGLIDDTLKRDEFGTSEQLRGHILRDVLWWVLNLPDIKGRLARLPRTDLLPEIKKHLDAIYCGDTKTVVEIVSSNEFRVDMQRFGTDAIRRELLCELLELGSLDPPSRVVDPMQRSRLLMSLLEDFSSSLLVPAALHEAKRLESTLNSLKYSFHVARVEARLHSKCERAMPALKKMIVCAWKSRDVHLVAEAQRAVAAHFSRHANHLRARRWYWRSIQTLCRMREICPHCLGMAFLGAAEESLSCSEFDKAHDELLKALLIARVIPDRRMQFTALLHLSRIYAGNDHVEGAVAASVIASSVAKETWPEDEETDLEAIISELLVTHGREKVSRVIKSIDTQDAESILGAMVDRCSLADFVTQLKLKPSSAGDHW